MLRRQKADSVQKSGENEHNTDGKTRKQASGFSALASLQSSDPDLQVYRRFASLASRNLAYLQSELMALEAEIASLDEEDVRDADEEAEGWLEKQLPARCWEVLERNANDEHNERDMQRMRLVRKLRSLMSDYQDALLRQSNVLKLEDPSSRSKDALTGWFVHHRPLIGHSYDIIDSAIAESDLVALHTPPDQDRLTIFLQNYAGYYFSGKKSDQHWEGINYFPDKTVHLVVSVVGIFITATLLIGAIVALYFAANEGLKLGLIALFTTIFAAGIGLLTNARKAEVYAATAAYVLLRMEYSTLTDVTHKQVCSCTRGVRE